MSTTNNRVSGGRNMNHEPVCKTCPHMKADPGRWGGWCQHPSNRVIDESWPQGFTPSQGSDGGCDLHPAHVSGVTEPVPGNVYWAPLADNFYDADGKGQGTEFYRKWKPRCAEFPQGESFGFGKGSAHNPFKDPPRTAGVLEVQVPAEATPSMLREIALRFAFDPQKEDLDMAAEAWRAALRAAGVNGPRGGQPE